ncbi:E3 ubiquitin-protein ligase listerin [Pelomyxa schiedti]|nr:E3 ubiquitin-protein ligase listerin [Pelomyxa schiedti]
MGKDRAKTKPASSKQAASLLTTGGSSSSGGHHAWSTTTSYASSGFTGFTGLTGLSSLSDPTSNLPPEMQLVIKKMFKSSSITKMKALDEFGALVAALDATTVDGVLSCWCLAYPRLSTDGDAQVREKSNHTLTVLVTHPVVKKCLLKYFKDLIGPWLCSSHDLRREVASAAMQAWKEIPEANRSKALMFCKEELLIHIRDNIRHTPQTLADHSRKEEPSVIQDRYDRVVSGAIGCFSSVISQIGSDNNRTLLAEYLQIADEPFWKMLGSKSVPIRRSMYSFVTSMLSAGMKELVEPHVPVVAGLVLGCFNEKEWSLHNAMWECLLMWMKYFPTSWEQVNFRKVVLPRLWAFLRASTYGSGSSSYPTLLPFLLLLPPTVVTFTDEDMFCRFYGEFFPSLWCGLLRELKNPGPTSTAGIAAFSECVSYVTTNINTSQAASVKVVIDTLSVAVESLVLFEVSTIDLVTSIGSISELVKKVDSKLNLEELWVHWLGVMREALVRDTFLPPPKPPTEQQPAVEGEGASSTTPAAQPILRTTPNVVSDRLAHFLQKWKNHFSTTRLPVVQQFCAELIPLSMAFAIEHLSLQHLKLLLALIGMCGRSPLDFEMEIMDLLPRSLIKYGSSSVSYLCSTATCLLQKAEELGTERHASVFGSLVKAILVPDIPLALTTSIISSILKSGGMKCTCSLLDSKALECAGGLLDVDDDQFHVNSNFLLVLLGEFKDSLQQEFATVLDDSTLSTLSNVLCATLTEAAREELSETIFDQLSHLTEVVTAVAISKIPFTQLCAMLVSYIWFIGGDFRNKALGCWKSILPKAALHQNFDIDTLQTCVIETLRKHPSITTHTKLTTSISDVLQVLANFVSTQSAPKTPLIEKALAVLQLDRASKLIVTTYTQRVGYTSSHVTPPILTQPPLLNSAALHDYISCCRLVLSLFTAFGIETVVSNGREWVLIHLLVASLHITSLQTDYWTETSCGNFAWLKSELDEACSKGIRLMRESGRLPVLVRSALLLSQETGASYAMVLDSLLTAEDALTAWDLLKTNILLGNIPQLLQYSDPALSTLQAICHQAKIPSTEKIPAVLSSLGTLLFSELAGAGSSTGTAATAPPISAARLDTLRRSVESIICLNKLCNTFEDPQFFSVSCQFLEKLPLTLLSANPVALFAILRLANCIIAVPTPSLLPGFCVALARLCIAGLSIGPDDDSSQSLTISKLPSYQACQVLQSLLSKYKTCVSVTLPDVFVSLLQCASKWCAVFSPGHSEAVRSAILLVQSQLHEQTIQDSVEANCESLMNVIHNGPPKLQLLAFFSLAALLRGKIQKVSKTNQRPPTTTPNSPSKVSPQTPDHAKHPHLSEDEFRKSLIDADSAPPPNWLPSSFVEALTTWTPVLESSRSLKHNGNTTLETEANSFPFLSLWAVIMHVLSSAPSTDSKIPLVGWIRRTNVLCSLLDLVVSQVMEKKIFPPLESPIVPDLEELPDCSLLSAFLYLQSLHHLPYVARQWATTQKRHIFHLVNEYTKLVTPLIVQREMDTVAAYKPDREDFHVHGDITTKQVVAIYEKDELKLEVTFTMPDIYPLRTVDVANTSARNGVSEATWRKWQLSMSAMLVTQDASLLDACMLWRSQLDRHFTGVEACPICYSLFAPNGAVPNLDCRTCHNKFHHACMYKWFTTSHKTACPLCGTDFAWRT